MDLARASLNSITVRSARLDELIAVADRNGLGGIALWRDVFAVDGVRAAARSVAASGLRVSSLCRAGMFVHGSVGERADALDDNLRAVEEAHELQAECLVLVCGGARDVPLATARRQIADGIAELVPVAADAGVRLAIEPMHPMMISDRSAITSLRQANDLVDAIAAGPTLGIALDAYHVFWEEGIEAEILRAGLGLQSVQICDWVTPIMGQLSSRGMPGEGTIDLPAFLAASDAAGYRGLIEIEVLSDYWWSRPVEEAAARALEGFAAL